MFGRMPSPSPVRSLLATVFLYLVSLVAAQPYDVRQGDGCPECAPDEIAVTVRGEARGAKSMQAHAPCALPPREVLDAAARRGDLTGPAFALNVPGDVRPAALRDTLLSLGADLQHPLAWLLNGFTSECLLLGVRVDENREVRGYELAAASPRTEARSCDALGGNCPFAGTGFSTTPAEMEIAGTRWVIALFRNYGSAGDIDGADRTGFLTVYLGSEGP